MSEFISLAIGMVHGIDNIWLAVIVICIVFDRKIPLSVWVLCALEAVAKGGSL